MGSAELLEFPPGQAEQDVSIVASELESLVKYMSVLGKDISADELIVGLPTTLGEFSFDDAPRALRRLGYVCETKRSRRLAKTRFPICARMKDGSYESVLGLEGGNFLISHPDLDGGVLKKDRKTFQQQYSGEYFIAAPTVDALEARHVGPNTRGHWFWKHITAQKWLSVEILVATLVANCLAVAVSLFALQVYDRVIPNASTQTLWVLACGALVAIVFESILRISRGRLIDDMGRQVEIRLSAELASKLQGMQMSDRVMGPAALGSMMREFSSVREFFTATSMGSIADIPFVFIFLGLIYMIAGPVVWVAVAALCLIILVSLFTRKTLSRISEDMQGANAAQSRLLNEMTYGAEAIKLGQAENRFQSAWEDIALLSSSKTQEQRATSARLTFVSQAIQQLAYVTAVVAGVYMVLAGSFSIGAIIAVSILSTRAIAPITQLSGAIARWQQVRVAMEGLSGIVNSRQERDQTRQYARRDNLRGDIDIQDLQFRYAEDQDTALHVKSLKIEAGETIAILGRNGSGKSTLLKILSGLYGFESGEVRLDGLEIRQIDPVDLRRNMGVLTQDITLFSGTLRDNLAISPRPFAEKDLEEALRFSGLWSMVERHPLGLDMLLSDGGVGLSVGQRQSLGLARIYLADPQIVLLDEPTAAMDQTLEKEVIARMAVWLQGKTCVLTTHRTEIIAICKKIGLIHEGQLALVGPRDEILEKLQGNRKP